jgi:hypothetical protein
MLPFITAITTRCCLHLAPVMPALFVLIINIVVGIIVIAVIIVIVVLSVVMAMRNAHSQEHTQSTVFLQNSITAARSLK